jgi:hypothetical protein
MQSAGAMVGRHRPNEWAPVHSSIAGPYIFVLGEGFLIDISSISRSDNAWPLRSDPVDMMFGLLAAQRGEQLLFTSMRRDLALEQGHWPEPVASCSSPSVVPTDICPHPLPAVRLHDRTPIPAKRGAKGSATPTGAACEMLRQIWSCVKLRRTKPAWVPPPASISTPENMRPSFTPWSGDTG